MKKRIFLVLKKCWPAIDASKGPITVFNTTIPAGRREVEEIPNPSGFLNTPWLVLKGTKIGATKGWWESFKDGPGEFEVKIEEEILD